MPSFLDAFLRQQHRVVDEVKPLAGNDPQRAEQAYTATLGSLLRGLEHKTQTSDGADSLWDMLNQQAERGKIPPAASSPQNNIQVHELDSQTVQDILSNIFGENAPQVEGGVGKVITLDPETSRKIFAKVLPGLLGAIFGAAKDSPQESRQALPNVIGDAWKEAEQRQPNLGGALAAMFDKDHDGDVDLNDLVGIFTNQGRN